MTAVVDVLADVIVLRIVVTVEIETGTSYTRVLRHKSEYNVVKFYIHGSAHRESNLITVQQDATYSVYYISVGSSTCFGC